MSKTRMGKRVASLLLSLVMMLSLLPTTVYATGDTGETKNAIAEANTSDDNTVGGTTGNPELTGEDEGGGGANVSEGETATVATIGSATYESLDEAITAVADGETIVVNAGEYTLNGSLNYTGKAFTIAAADGADVSFDMSAAVALHGAKITFNNVTFDYKTNGNYIGLQHADTLVYNNCTINGVVFLYAVNETFNSCKFYQDSADAYNVWTYGAQNVAFNGCTFNCVGKAVLVYNEGAVAKTDLTVKDTKFIASAPVEDKAAIEIDTSLMEGGATITVDDKTTAAGFDNGSNSGNPLWNDKKQTADTNKNTTVTVAGEKVFEPKATASAVATTKDGREYATLTEALAAVTESNPLTSVTEEAWPAATPVYYNGSFYATIGELLYDAQQKTGAITPENAPDTAVIYCRPGTTIPTGKASHPSFVTSTTIYGNGATLSGSTEWDVENYYTLTKDITINLYSLNGGASVWGTRRSDYTVTVNMVDCKDAHEVLFNYGSGNGRVDVTVKDSTFLKSGGAAHGWPVSINCLGSLLVDGCTFDGVTTGVVVNVKQPSENGAMAVTVKNSTFNNVTGQDSNKGALRVTGQQACDIDLTIENVAFTGTHADPEDITIGNVKSEENLGKVSYNISGTDASMTTHKAGATEATKETLVSGTTYTGTNAATAAGDGTEANPYTLAQLGAMTRQEYIAAQNRLNGTMYVTVGNYAYDINGVLGNGVRDDTTGQIPDHSKLNAYGENGYLGEKNDGANGKSVVFVGGSITSGVTGYTSIDKIGTSLLLALPAYTNVTFKGITFNNVMSFNYQLYTSPWSQLGELKFDGCTFNGIIVGAIAAQTLTFNGCEFKNYTNTTDANSSNPTWIRPAYGNWTQGDNEGQGSDFRSLTAINFTGNTVTSTRPVKFEYISQWDITSTVTATGNSFDISKQAGDTAIKNVGLYLGAHTDANAFNLVAENNTKSANTAALYTIPEGETSLPLGSTVKNLAGEPVELTDALKWKAGDAETDKIVLETVEAVASVGSKQYGSLQAAIDAATAGQTVTLLADVNENVEIAAGKELTLDLNGKTLSGGTGTAKAALYNLGTITMRDTSEAKTGTIKRDDNGTVGETSYYVIRNWGTMTIESGNVINNSGYRKVNSTGSMVGSSLICNGDCDEGGTLTIKGGTFTQNNFIAIKNGVLGVLKVTGGTITSNHSAIQNWFEADITGGKITGQLWTDAWEEGKSVGKTTIGGDATFAGEIVMDITGSVAPTLAINGGNLNVTRWRITNDAANAGAKPAVSGGTFSSAVPAKYCAEGFIPTANADGTYGVKAGAYVAQIGDVKYETLKDAINAANAGETVTLLADATEDVTINKNITLDLGGKTLTNTSSGKATISVKDSAVVTVKNGFVMGGTKYYNIEVTKDSNANLTLMGVTATAGNTSSSMIDNWGTLTIESGTYEGGLNVVKSEEGSTLTINGGKFTGTYAISNYYNGVILSAGTTTINDGEFIQSATEPYWGCPQVVLAMQVTGYTSLVTVNGGTFTNEHSRSGAKIFHPGTGATSDNLAVKGGTFNKSVPDSYFKDGYFAKKNGSVYETVGPFDAKIGTTGYATLEAAYAAAKNGNTITLLRDCESGRINLEDKSVTVDLNGKVLTSTAAYGVMFCAKNGHKITVKGTTAGSKLVGTLMVTAKTDGHIVINGGTYESDKYCPIYINGDVSSDNSTLTVKNATITALPGDSNQDNGVAVYLAGYSTSTFTRTTITAPVTGLEIRAGKLTLTDCTVTGGSGEVVTNANGNGTTVTNAAVAISQHTTKKDIDVTITGGTYTATAAVYQTNVQGTGSENVKVSIQSGTFKGAVSAETNNTVAISGGTFSSAVPENCCAAGYIPKDNGDGTYGVKEGVYVAQIRDAKYETLQAAIDAAKGGSTVRLLANVTLTETVVFPAGKKVDLNLAGHNITATGTALRINGTTDIQSTGSVGTIESTGNVAVAVGNNAKVTVYSGTLKGREGAVITCMTTAATTEIRYNATLIATDNAVIAGNGSQRDGKPNTILVKGSTFIGGIVTDGYIACGIYAPWNDNVTVSGGTFNITNGAGIVARAGTVKVTGGTFNCGDGTAEGWVGDSKNKVPCAALVFDKAANYPALTESSQILVSGGSFSTDPAANGATLADGYVANKDESGMYKVAKANPVAEINGVKYDTLQAAINAAQATKGGATITLLKNINTESYYMVNGDNPVTIDLAGHNITGSGISGLFYVTAKGDLTIKGEGTVTAVEDNGAAMAVWVRSPIAKVTLEGGTYTQQITNTADPHFDLIYVERGNVYVKGGTYKGFTPDWTLNCKDEYYQSKEANIEVTGGTFVGFDPANNKAEGENTNFVAAGYVSTKGADGNFVVTEVKVAEVNGVAYATLSEAIAAAKDGDIVTLLRDINTPEISYMISKSLTIDLNGMTVTGSGYDAVFQIDNADAKVVIKNGKVVAVEQSGSAGKYTMAIWASKAGCEVTLEGLDVSQKITHTDDPQMDMIYASGGTITINSGNFVSGTPAWTLNCNDTSYKNGTANIIVKGGTFVGFDPANNKAEGKGTNFVAAGYVSNMDEDGSYTVVPEDAKITVNKSLTLGNTLTMTYKVLLPEGYTSEKMVFEFYNDDIKGYDTVEVLNGNYNNTTKRYEFAFTGINPQRMNDTLKAKMYAKDANGNEVIYSVDDYSVAMYCNALLSSEANKDGKYTKLIASLVAYGTASQKYMNYRTDTLVSSIVDAGAADDYTAQLAAVQAVNNRIPGTGVTIKAKSLVLTNAFAIRVKFVLDSNVSIDDVYFTVNSDSTQYKEFKQSTLSDGTVCYYFDYTGLNASELDDTFTFTAHTGTGTGDALAYNANTYLNGMYKVLADRGDTTSALYEIVTALFNYGWTCNHF